MPNDVEGDDLDRHEPPTHRLDAVCDRFEAEWRAGLDPRIEDYLAATEEAGRLPLFRELLGLELDLRRESGQHPDPGEYRARFPERASLIQAAFAVRPSRSRDAPAQAGMDTARNLLLGILALQNNFVSRDELVAAFAAWVADRSRLLGQILLDHAALDSGRLALLEALVQEHLKLHGANPELSLAALPTFDAARRDMERLEDPWLQTTLLLIGEVQAGRDGRTDGTTVSHRARGQSHSPSAAVDSEPDSDFAHSIAQPESRYQILRPHARGGLGEIFVARDEELNREVALKQIRETSADDPDSRARFVLEAEITGRLEHPGVVPVYGFGADARGRPYYAMRLIGGDSLKESIDAFRAGPPARRAGGAGALGFRRLLQRFLAVCDAVAYAHSRGILHRDLKPRNVMLGHYGETLVVDWGLAKPIGRPEGAERTPEGTLRPSAATGLATTQHGSAIGTPQYMSPEQAAGRLDQLGPASDVYSLGATLYYLLTGKPPFEGDDLSEMLQRVCSGAFPPPRTVDASVPRALEAICLKAMALEPADRYPTPRVLAEDIEHWLADEPALAYHDPILTRAARWARKHKTVVTGAAVLVLAGVAGLAVHNVRIERERRRAEENFATARRLANDLLKRVAGEELAYVPGVETLRRTVAERALQEYQGLLQSRPDDPSLRSDAATAYREVANIERLTGGLEAPRAHYREAAALLESLRAESPLVDEYPHRLAAVAIDLGELLRKNGRLREAEESYLLALAEVGKLRLRKPDDPAFRRTEASGLLDLAAALRSRGDWPGAQRAARQAVTLLAGLAASPKPARVDLLLHIAALVNLGTALRDAGDSGGGRKALDDAVARARSLRASAPRDPNPTYFLAECLIERGELLATDGSTAAAVHDYDESVKLLTPLIRTGSTIPSYRLGLAAAHDGLGASLAAAGEPDKGDRECQASRRYLEALLRSRDVPDYHTQLGRTLGDHARIALAKGKTADARTLLLQAVEQQSLALKACPESWSDRRLLDRHRGDLDAIASSPSRPRQP
jgi:serine/threonine-protein kinase